MKSRILNLLLTLLLTQTLYSLPADTYKVSIISVIDNNSEFVEGYLKDITKQTVFNECEIILINNNYAHFKEKIIKNYCNQYPNIKYINLNKIFDFYALLNLGIKLSKAEYICNFNIEDRFNSKLLELYINELDQNPSIDLVYSGYYITYNANETFENNKYRWIVEPDEFSIKAMQKYLPGPAPLWRKSLHKKNGFFDKNYKYAGNWHMWLKAVSNGSIFKKIPGIHTLHYNSEKEKTDNTKITEENNKIIKEYEYLWTQDHEAKKDIIVQNKKFVIVIPSYNNKYWFQRNLNSVFSQKYKNYRVIYIDDCSPDKTGELVESYTNFLEKKDIVKLIKNKERKGALENLYNAIHSCEPDEIIVTLDGDDWFANENVLTYLNNIYQDPGIWITYGQFVYYPSNSPGWAQETPGHIIAQNSYRENAWRTTHLRTFYAGLFHKIKREDFLHEGKFFPMAWDLAFMFPMMEMAGTKSKFISQVLYIYNFATNINDEKVNRNLQIHLENIIRSKPKYKPIKSLFNKNKKKIYIFAYLWADLFDINNVTANRDGSLEPTYQLKEELEKLNIELAQANSPDNLDDADFIVCFNLSKDNIDRLKNYPKEKLIVFLWEPPTTTGDNYDKKFHEHFSKIYTCCDDLIDNQKYFKFYYPALNPMIENSPDFNNKKLCTMVAMNKSSQYQNELYSHRKKIIDFFENLDEKDFDFYGMFWDKTKYKNYKGQITKKVDFLKHYKFCICYENTKGLNGYVSEKIFDCFRAGCVPVYWGAPNIQKYIPENCFISRENFATDEELYLFLKNMPRETYNDYISNIKKFLLSTGAQLYSIKNFINIFKESCQIN